jgi:hypothetical protein
MEPRLQYASSADRVSVAFYTVREGVEDSNETSTAHRKGWLWSRQDSGHARSKLTLFRQLCPTRSSFLMGSRTGGSRYPSLSISTAALAAWKNS